MMGRYYLCSVAFRCSESEFNKNLTDGISLSDKLHEAGFKTDELDFSSGKEYVANYSRGKSATLSCVDRPDKAHVYVFEKWDAELFFAFCCQTSSPKILPGEFYIDPFGKMHRAKTCSKEQIDQFKSKDIKKAGVLDFITLYNKRNDNGEDLLIVADTLDELSELAKSDSVGIDVRSHGYSLSEYDMIEYMRTGAEVFYGSYWKEQGHIYSVPVRIMGMTKDQILIDSEHDNNCNYGELFATQADFARYIIGLEEQH